MAASTVTHTSSPDSTVAEGSIHCRCALAGTTASVAAAIVAVKPRIIFFMPCPFEKSAERSEEHTSELQSLMSISYAVFCLKKKKNIKTHKPSEYSNK